MKRYLKIYWIIIKLNVALLFTYRANFYNSIIIQVGWGIISIVSIFLITAKVSHIYSWSREDLYLLAGIYSTVIGVFHVFFSASLERFGLIISRGELDSYLLTPVDVQLYLSTKFFRPAALLRIIISVVFTAIIITQLHVVVSPVTLISSILLFSFGILLLYSLWFLVVTTMIWNPNLTNLIDFLYVANNIGRYPAAIVTYTKNIFLYFVIPLMLVTTTPSNILLGKSNIWEIGLLVTFSLGLFIASRYFWKFALKYYVSASS